MKIKEIKATGEYVVVRFEEVNKELYSANSSGILVQNSDTQKGKKHRAIIHDIGPLADAEKLGFKVGDTVLWNEYDMKTIDDDEGEIYGICKASSIMVVYSAK